MGDHHRNKQNKNTVNHLSASKQKKWFEKV